MRIVIADKFAESARALLAEDGHKILFDPGLNGDSLRDALSDENPQMLVVRSTKVDASMLHAASNLALVVRAGAGVNTIDLETASRMGIYVANCPGKNAVAVAELTIGLILSLDRRIPDNVADLRAGQWNKKLYGSASGLKGRTLGLIGLGSIGREVCRRARAFDMSVVAWGRSLTESQAAELGITRCESPVAVAAASDIVSVHVALSGETRGLCDASFFSSMRDGALFINTARGDIVDEQALLDAIETKGIRAGLDVFDNEPSSGQSSWDSPAGKHASVYGTHHIGASTDQATAAIGAEALRVVRAYAKSGTVLNCVNLEPNPAASHTLSIRHKNRVGVLAKVLNELQKASLNVLDMENQLFQWEDAATATIHLCSEPSSDVLIALQSASDAILAVRVSARGSGQG